MIMNAYKYLFYSVYKMSARRSSRSASDNVDYACMGVSLITALYIFAACSIVRSLLGLGGDLFPSIMGFDAAIPVAIMFASYMISSYFFRRKARYLDVLNEYHNKDEKNHDLIFLSNFALALCMLVLSAFIGS